MTTKHKPAQRPRLKDTPVGRIPSSWKVSRLRDLCRGKPSYGSSTAARDYDADLPRYVRISDISRDGILRRNSRASIPVRAAEPHRLHPGDLLFARSGATCGKTYLYNPRDGDCAYAGYLIRFALDDTRCEPAFVARWTQSSYYRAWLGRTVREAAQPNINAAEFGDLLIPQPPRLEQRRIANVLASADRVISCSERIVAKLATTRADLVREMLTQGVGENGATSRHSPRRYSPIGQVPEHFSVVRLESLLAPCGPGIPPALRSGPFGSELRKSEFVADGVPLLGIDNVGVESFVAEFKRRVSHRKYIELKRFAVRPGDVMVTVMGTVGRSCVMPDGVGQALSSKHIWVMTIDRQRYLPELLSLQINFAPWVRRHFRREEQGGTMEAIRSDTLKSILLPVPPLAEQRRMLKVFTALHRRIDREAAELSKRRLLRQSLIDALCTGQVRVPK